MLELDPRSSRQPGNNSERESDDCRGLFKAPVQQLQQHQAAVPRSFQRIGLAYHHSSLSLESLHSNRSFLSFVENEEEDAALLRSRTRNSKASIWLEQSINPLRPIMTASRLVRKLLGDKNCANILKELSLQQPDCCTLRTIGFGAVLFDNLKKTHVEQKRALHPALPVLLALQGHTKATLALLVVSVVADLLYQVHSYRHGSSPPMLGAMYMAVTLIINLGFFVFNILQLKKYRTPAQVWNSSRLGASTSISESCYLSFMGLDALSKAETEAKQVWGGSSSVPPRSSSLMVIRNSRVDPNEFDPPAKCLSFEADAASTASTTLPEVGGAGNGQEYDAGNNRPRKNDREHGSYFADAKKEILKKTILETFLLNFSNSSVVILFCVVNSMIIHFRAGEWFLFCLLLGVFWNKVVISISSFTTSFYIRLSQRLHKFDLVTLQHDVRNCSVGDVPLIIPRISKTHQDLYQVCNTSHKFFFQWLLVGVLFFIVSGLGLYSLSVAQESGKIPFWFAFYTIEVSRRQEADNQATTPTRAVGPSCCSSLISSAIFSPAVFLLTCSPSCFLLLPADHRDSKPVLGLCR